MGTGVSAVSVMSVPIGSGLRESDDLQLRRPIEAIGAEGRSALAQPLWVPVGLAPGVGVGTRHGTILAGAGRGPCGVNIAI